jgi:hypothetical protein
VKSRRQWLSPCTARADHAACLCVYVKTGKSLGLALVMVPRVLTSRESAERRRKEMFRDHFFFDKIVKLELEPLKREQMLEAYRKRFKGHEPFAEDALLTLARMSRGIFRRFLRYVILTLQHSESHGERIIDAETVKAAVTVKRLAIENYAMSRLLAKLELHRYITRQREGTDKVVSPRKKE